MKLLWDDQLRALQWLLAEARWWAENEAGYETHAVVEYRKSVGLSSLSVSHPWDVWWPR